MLHQGRFREASALFRSVSERRPGDPEGPLYEALTTWWRLQDAPKNRSLQDLVMEQLQEATRRADALMETGQAGRARLLGGTAYMLLAQRLVDEKSLFSAGSAARKGHRLLESHLAEEPGSVDAWFALGAYKYYAARLPWIVRAIRFLTFIPGGNAREGLEGLERAARAGRFFGFESRLLLAWIYLSEEKDSREALGHLDRARVVRPSSPLLNLIRSRVLFESGRLEKAGEAAREVVRLAGLAEGTATQVVDMAHLRLALSLYYRYRHREAWEALAPLRRPGGTTLPEGHAKRLQGLTLRLRLDLRRVLEEGGGIVATGGKDAEARPVTAAPVPRGEEGALALSMFAAGETAKALDKLAAILAEDAGDPVARYHLGRIYQEAGRKEEAIAELDRVLHSDRKVAKVLKGWTMIRLGLALREKGRTQAGEDYLAAASRLKGFPFKLAALERLDYPDPSPPVEG